MVLDVTLAINWNSDDGEIGVRYRRFHFLESSSRSFDLSLILLPILSLERSDRERGYLGACDPSLIGVTGSWWRRRAMEKEGGDGGGEKGGGQQDAASLLDAASLFVRCGTLVYPGDELGVSLGAAAQCIHLSVQREYAPFTSPVRYLALFHYDIAHKIASWCNSSRGCTWCHTIRYRHGLTGLPHSHIRPVERIVHPASSPRAVAIRLSGYPATPQHDAVASAECGQYCNNR
uniref:Uncharacterized protein n=1 Tax=Timema cristinae TaxID=61476 RepID=A0A7R9CCW1_TIMCR|nr:unnamed protein product [Timema cristinae]